MLAYITMPLLFVLGAPSPVLPSVSASVLPVAERFALPVQPMVINDAVTDKDGFVVDRISWTDGMSARRSATLVHNDVMDPVGFWGGYLRTYTLYTDQGMRTCTGSLKEQPGFGYTVNHFHGGVNSNRRYKGDAWRYVLRGAHHAILEQSWTYPVGDGNVKATVQWLFATGRSHPLYSVTFDSSGAGPNVLNADSRAPYGDIGWDGDAHAPVDGVAWGDRFAFKTLRGPVTPATGWEYTKANTVPYTWSYSIAADGEMGLVQTQTIDQHDAGGYDGYKLWRTRSRQGPMPDPASWPYQINQWELPYDNSSKRMAWGLNYGAVGQTAYSAYGNDRTLSGYPFQSYSTYVVIGSHSRHEVMDQVQQIEAIQRSAITVTGAGTLELSGKAGVGRADGAEWDKPGFNPVYGTFEGSYTGTGAPMTFNFTVNGKTALHGTVLVVHNWTFAAPEVAINGKTWAPNRVAFATVDAPSRTLWLSLTEPLPTGVTAIVLTPQTDDSGQKSNR